ncbi:hypothetical protein ILYODFUR_007809, partial [Ilyodon furcidens]
CVLQERVGGEELSSWSISLSTPHPSAFPPFNQNNAVVLPATLCRLFQRTSEKEKQIEAAEDNETAGYSKAVHFAILYFLFHGDEQLYIFQPAGGDVSKLSSVTLQLLLNLTSVYFVFYFLFTLSLIIKKSLELPYPSDALVCDVGLLVLLAALEFLHFFCGVKGNLTESEGYIFGNLIVTATTILLTVYFLLWQTYVMRADVIISSVLVAVYGADGVLALSTLARFARQ